MHELAAHSVWSLCPRERGHGVSIFWRPRLPVSILADQGIGKDDELKTMATRATFGGLPVAVSGW